MSLVFRSAHAKILSIAREASDTTRMCGFRGAGQWPPSPHFRECYLPCSQRNPTPLRIALRSEQVLSAIHQASPSGQLFSLSDPLLSGTVVYALVDLRAPGDFSHRDIITLSTTDARVLTIWHYGQNRTAGDWFLWAMHPLHFGTLWGMFFKVVWAACGLCLAVLAITGLLMYWNRFLRHRF